MLTGRGQPKPPGVTCRIVLAASCEILTQTRNAISSLVTSDPRTVIVNMTLLSEFEVPVGTSERINPGRRRQLPHA
jgi:hypothetical protein